MTDVIKQWILKKLGLPVSFSQGTDMVRTELSNGHLIGEILRKYHLISDDMLMNLTDSICLKDRNKNMKILHTWLRATSFEVDINDLKEISEGKPGAVISFLYRMYLWLEGPGSKPGLQQRSKTDKEKSLQVRQEKRYSVKDPLLMEDDLNTDEEAEKRKFSAFVKSGREDKDEQQRKKSSLFVHVVSNESSEIVTAAQPCTNKRKSCSAKVQPLDEFLQRLEQSLVVRKATVSKLVVSPLELESHYTRKSEDRTRRKSSAPPEEIKQMSDQQIEFVPRNRWKTSRSSTLKEEAAPTFKMDTRGLNTLDCGKMPIIYRKNVPFGNLSEELQAGRVYFHSKGMMILKELTAKRNVYKIPTRIDGRQKYLGIYEDVQRSLRDKVANRMADSHVEMMGEIIKFDDMLSSAQEPLAGDNEDRCSEIYVDGKGNWEYAKSRIYSIKSRRRKEKIYFNNRCTKRKILAAKIAKSFICDANLELDEILHDKLTQMSREEHFLAEFCANSHLEKSAFLDHIKVEQEQLLNMGITQTSREYIHNERLTEIERKVREIVDANNTHIKNETLASERRAKLILVIKFCEEIFSVLIHTAIKFSEYRSLNNKIPPQSLLLEWRDSLYAGGCVSDLRLLEDSNHVKKPDENRKCKKASKLSKVSFNSKNSGVNKGSTKSVTSGVNTGKISGIIYTKDMEEGGESRRSSSNHGEGSVTSVKSAPKSVQSVTMAGMNPKIANLSNTDVKKKSIPREEERKLTKLKSKELKKGSSIDKASIITKRKTLQKISPINKGNLNNKSAAVNKGKTNKQPPAGKK